MQKLDGISIIIPTWNKKVLVVNCLKILDKVLTKTVSLPMEIIVVENGSDDGSLAALMQLKLKTPLVILTQKVNLGFAKAINLATLKARYNYLYLMNNDMEAQENTFGKLIAFTQKLIAEKKNFLAVASQVFFFDKNKPRLESGKTYCFTSLGMIHIRHMVNPESLSESGLTLYGGGGSTLFSKKVFLTLGGFDARRYQPMYVEDLDLGVMGWERGYPSYFCAESQILHHHRSSSKKWKVSPDQIIKKNLKIFMLKHWRWLSKPLLKNFVLFEMNEGQQFL